MGSFTMDACWNELSRQCQFIFEFLDSRTPDNTFRTSWYRQGSTVNEISLVEGFSMVDTTTNFAGQSAGIADIIRPNGAHHARR